MAKTILITGNTFPVKDAIKALGGRWDADARGWRVPAAKAGAARELVAGAPKSEPRGSRFSAASYSRGTTRARGPVGRCWECGCTGVMNRDGMCGMC